MFSSIISLKPSLLGAIQEERAVELFGQILFADATRLGLSRMAVSVSLKTKTPDGGADAAIQTPHNIIGSVFSGPTIFQIKTGSKFRPWILKDLKKELFKKSIVLPENLGSEVLKCLIEKRTYSLVTFGHDMTSRDREKSALNLQGLFSQCGYPNHPVEILGQSQIADAITRYPSLCLSVKGDASLNFQTHSSWARDADLVDQIAIGAEAASFIDKFHETIFSKNTRQIRICGVSGIGKTHLVLCALSIPHLSPSVLYLKNPYGFDGGALFSDLLSSHRDYSSIIVVDNCSDMDRSELWRTFKNSHNIKLVTIDRSSTSVCDSSSITIQAPKTDYLGIAEIISRYLPKGKNSIYWSNMCDGLPRLAHLIGENLKNNALSIIDESTLLKTWDRLIDPQSIPYGELESYRLVLQTISLFSSFRLGTPNHTESDHIHSIIQKIEPLLTLPKFHRIIQHFINSGILSFHYSGELLITPRMFQFHLWKEWWCFYGNGFNFSRLVDEIPRPMLRKFYRQFSNANISKPTKEFAKQFFFNPDSWNSDDGFYLASQICESFPQEILDLFSHKIRNFSVLEKNEFLTNPDVAYTFRKLSARKNFFKDTCFFIVSIFSSLNYSIHFYPIKHKQPVLFTGSATALRNLFSPVAGSTEATLRERRDFLIFLISHQNLNFQSIGLDLSYHFFDLNVSWREIDVEFQGLDPELDFLSSLKFSDITWLGLPLMKKINLMKTKMDNFPLAICVFGCIANISHRLCTPLHTPKIVRIALSIVPFINHSSFDLFEKQKITSMALRAMAVYKLKTGIEDQRLVSFNNKIK